MKGRGGKGERREKREERREAIRKQNRRRKDKKDCSLPSTSSSLSCGPAVIDRLDLIFVCSFLEILSFR